MEAVEVDQGRDQDQRCQHEPREHADPRVGPDILSRREEKQDDRRCVVRAEEGRGQGRLDRPCEVAVGVLGADVELERRDKREAAADEQEPARPQRDRPRPAPVDLMSQAACRDLRRA
jgi:hypothetical protein